MEARPATKYSVSDIPGVVERRVFIAGNYDNIAVLRLIAKMVEKIGLQPILALEFDVLQDKVRQRDLMLLHSCTYAIFEVTFGNGHLAEIERAVDYDVKALLVYQARDEERKPPSGVTSMLPTSAFPTYGYLTFDDLGVYLRSFFEAEGITVTPPIDRLKPIEGYCDSCGEWSERLIHIDDRYLCERCWLEMTVGI